MDISPASASKHYNDNFPKILTAMKAVDFKKPKSANDAKKEAKNQLKDLIRDDILLNAILSNIKLRSDQTIGWTVNIETLIKYMKHIVSFPNMMKGKRYFGPTLFIGGQLSEFIP